MIKRFHRIWLAYRAFVKKMVEPRKAEIAYIRKMAKKDLIRAWAIAIQRHAEDGRDELREERRAELNQRVQRRLFNDAADDTSDVDDDSDISVSDLDIGVDKQQEEVIHYDYSLNLGG